MKVVKTALHLCVSTRRENAANQGKLLANSSPMSDEQNDVICFGIEAREDAEMA